jgi:hypothetical protein
MSVLSVLNPSMALTLCQSSFAAKVLQALLIRYCRQIVQ